MTLPDVTVLVEAGHRDARQHKASSAWLSDVLAGSRPVGLADAVLTGCLRVLTHRKAFADPPTLRATWAFVEAVRQARPQCRSRRRRRPGGNWDSC